MLIFGGPADSRRSGRGAAQPPPVYEAVLEKIYQSIGGYLGGLTLICSINATLTTTFLAIDGVPFFLPLGILSGLSSMVPYAGPLVAGHGISLSPCSPGVGHGVARGIYFIVYGQLEGNILGPLIFRRTVHVNPLVMTLSILFLGEIAGHHGRDRRGPVVADAADHAARAAARAPRAG